MLSKTVYFQELADEENLNLPDDAEGNDYAVDNLRKLCQQKKSSKIDRQDTYHIDYMIFYFHPLEELATDQAEPNQEEANCKFSNLVPVSKNL